MIKVQNSLTCFCYYKYTTTMLYFGLRSIRSLLTLLNSIKPFQWEELSLAKFSVSIPKSAESGNTTGFFFFKLKSSLKQEKVTLCFSFQNCFWNPEQCRHTIINLVQKNLIQRNNIKYRPYDDNLVPLIVRPIIA